MDKDIPGNPYMYYNYTPAVEIYTLSLHDALPISDNLRPRRVRLRGDEGGCERVPAQGRAARAACSRARKSTRLNSSHRTNSYAVFCLKKKRREGYMVAIWCLSFVIFLYRSTLEKL